MGWAEHFFDFKVHSSIYIYIVFIHDWIRILQSNFLWACN